MPGVSHVAVEREHFTLMDTAHTGNEGQQGRLADTVRTDQPDNAVGRNVERDVVERDGLTVAMRQPLHACGNRGGHGSFTASLSGHGVSGLLRT